MYLLGDIFIRNFYSTFDFDKKEIRLAVNIHSKDFAKIIDARERNQILKLVLILLLFIGLTYGAFVILTKIMDKRMRARVQRSKIKQ
mmetsp:Transcript_6911/g.11651  ORF Transcript_6911/g.11651 Transcript_6911/m.11651 type:complete len:87 (+) Transcript_6911:238-498(+)